MLRIGICDDAGETVEYHAGMMKRIMEQLGMNADIRKCYTGNELLMEMEDNGNFHLILLDIEMESLNGIETAQKIRCRDPYVVLIFISAYDQYCKAAIGVQPFDYLDKPVPYSRLKRSVEEAYERQIEAGESYVIQMNRMYHSIDLKNVYYFRSELRKIYVTGKQPEYWFYGKLDKIEEALKNKRHKFLRIHKSFLVNCRYIARHGYDRIMLRNGEELEVSRSNRSKVRKYYMEQMEQ